MERLHYLPTPYPDESFSSLIARTAERTAIKANHIFWGGENAWPTFRFVNGARGLVEHLPTDQIAPKDVIQQFCIYPYYAPFVTPKDRVNHLRFALTGNRLRAGNSLARRAGKPPSPAAARLCPDCVIEDTNKFGEPYYHRRHQLPGIQVCLVHHVYLQEVGWVYNSLTPVSAGKMLSRTLTSKRIPVKIDSALSDFLRDSLEELFSRNCFQNHPTDFRPLYRHSAGLNHGRNNAKIEAIVRQIQTSYGVDFSAAFDSDLWLKRAIFSLLGNTPLQQSAPTIAHLILLHHFGLSLKTALFHARHSLWACPNGLCDSYGKFVLGPPIVGPKSYRCQCSQCLMVFTFNRHHKIGSIPRVGRLIDAGPKLESKLSALFRGGTKLQPLAKLTHLGPQLVAGLLQGLGFHVGGFKWKPYKDKIAEMTATRKEEVVKWLQENPTATRSHLARSMSGPVIFLRREDPEWCETHLPKAIPKGFRPRIPSLGDSGPSN